MSVDSEVFHNTEFGDGAGFLVVPKLPQRGFDTRETSNPFFGGHVVLETLIDEPSVVML